MRMQIRVAGRRQIDSYHPDSVAQSKDARGPKVISMVAPFHNLIAIGNHRDSGSPFVLFLLYRDNERKATGFKRKSSPLETAVLGRRRFPVKLQSLSIAGKTGPNQRHYK
jgi:hypothetical protein